MRLGDRYTAQRLDAASGIDLIRRVPRGAHPPSRKTNPKPLMLCRPGSLPVMGNKISDPVPGKSRFENTQMTWLTPFNNCPHLAATLPERSPWPVNTSSWLRSSWSHPTAASPRIEVRLNGAGCETDSVLDRRLG